MDRSQIVPPAGSALPPDWLDRVIIREVERSDLPDLEWEGEFIHFRRLFASAFERARLGLSVLWIATLPGEGLIGQVFIQLTCDRPELADGRKRAYLYSFRVRQRYRSQGLGTYMLRHLEDDLIRRGYRSLTLNVAKDNPRARQLYERAGFRVVAHEPGEWSYPDHNGVWQKVIEPAWRMEKSLSGQGFASA